MKNRIVEIGLTSFNSEYFTGNFVTLFIIKYLSNQIPYMEKLKLIEKTTTNKIN